MSANYSEKDEKPVISGECFGWSIFGFLLGNLICCCIISNSYQEHFMELIKLLLIFDTLLLVMIKILIKYVKK